MKKLTVTIAISILATLFAFAQSKEQPATSAIVIIHGSWSFASDWDRVAAKLKVNGSQVIVINLPAHGADQTTMTTINLQGYVDAVKKVIGKKTDIILVGHSFGGIITSSVAEQISG